VDEWRVLAAYAAARQVRPAGGRSRYSRFTWPSSTPIVRDRGRRRVRRTS
jgi:hypothetical protein